jgi:hypothetical protein
VNEQIRPNVLAPHSAKWWNGKVWVETPSTLATLLIGRAYFVAERFEDAELAANG